MIERYIRILRASGSIGGEQQWRTIPGADRVLVWEMSRADSEDAEKLLILHIGFIEGVQRGCRAVYLGQALDISSVSDSPKLRGLELRCRPIAASNTPPAPARDTA